MTEPIQIQFPLAGVNRRTSFQMRPPYSTPHALNVCPYGGSESRTGGGSRPGFVMLYHSRPSFGTQVQALMPVSTTKHRGIESDEYSYYGSEFQYGIGAEFNGSLAPTIASVDPDAMLGSMPLLDHGLAYSEQDGDWRGLVRTADWTDDEYQMYQAVRVIPDHGKFCGSVALFPWMPFVTTTKEALGWRFLLTWLGGRSYRVDIAVHDDGYSAWAQLDSFVGEVESICPLWFSVFMRRADETYSGKREYRVVLNGTVVHSFFAATTTTQVPSVAFALRGDENGRAQIDTMSVGILLAAADRSSVISPVMLSVIGGDVYREYVPGWSASVGGTGNDGLDSTRLLETTEYNQLLYVADTIDPTVDCTEGYFRYANSTPTLVANGPSITSIGPNDYIEVYATYRYNGGNHPLLIGTHRPVERIGNTIDIDPNFVADDLKVDGLYTGARWRLMTGGSLKVYDPRANTTTDIGYDKADYEEFSSIPPINCRLICTYRDRIVLAGQDSAPHLFYMSRRGDPEDWDYSQLAYGDTDSAIAAQVSTAGDIGKPIKALCPVGDDYLIIGCDRELWVMRGDIASGGSLTNLSRLAGIVGPRAWCLSDTNYLYFISTDGLWRLAPGATTYPENLSTNLVPQELWRLDAGRYDVLLSYDAKVRSVWIFAYDRDGGNHVSYLYSVDSESFWPIRMPSDAYPVSATIGPAGSQYDGWTVFGCTDGSLRTFDIRAGADATGLFESRVLLGPLQPSGNPVYTSAFVGITGTLSEDSGAVRWYTLYSDTLEGVSKKAEDIALLLSEGGGLVLDESGSPLAIEQYGCDLQDSGTWTAGLNYRDLPNAVGGALGVLLDGSSPAPWRVEDVIVDARRNAGRRRKL